jgi:hypothetical protein
VDGERRERRGLRLRSGSRDGSTNRWRLDAIQPLFALHAGAVAFEFFEPAQKGALGAGFVAEGQGVFVMLTFGPMPEMHVFFVVDFVETALAAHEEPLGMRGLIDEQAFSGILWIVLLKPAFDDGGVFSGIFVAQDNLLGTAAVGEAIHRRDCLAGFSAGSGGVAGFGIFCLRVHGCAAFCEHVRRTACRAAVPFSCKALIPGEKKDFKFS